MKTTLENVIPYEFRCFSENNGTLIPVESNVDVPFLIKRVFYVYGITDETVRGKHAHYKSEQVLVCFNGRIDVKCFDGSGWGNYILDSPRKALLIPAMIWDEQIYYKDSILCVFSNQKYERNDYITDFEKFKELKND